MIASLAVVVSFVVGLGGIGACVWAMAHLRGMDTTIGLIRAGNAELRSELTHERDERHRERVECAREIARMEGGMQILTDGLGEKIAAAAIAALFDPERRRAPVIGPTPI